MLLTRLYLRNFRVYEDEVELHLPPGLVGIYGPNGAGKSTLLEAVLFTLWGKARTTKDQVRSSGVGGECVTEVEFEHEGHVHVVRRSLRGVNASVSVEVQTDGVLMSSGTRDAERYVESILGMDDQAFRASVFAEQKQLSAFSDHSPAERRKLVLGLLGITPLDAARDSARRDAKERAALHDRARGLLADLDALAVEADDADARAGAATERAAADQRAATAAEERAVRAATVLTDSEKDRMAYEALVERGKAARQTVDDITLEVDTLRAELQDLDGAAATLPDLDAQAAGLDTAGRELELVVAAAGAARIAEDAARVVPAEPPAPDDAALEAVRLAAADAREDLVRAESLLHAAEASLGHARDLSERSAKLSGEEDCPMCGQHLGDAFESVQAHRQAELTEAQERVAPLSRQLEAAGRRAAEEDARLTEASTRQDAARSARSAWEHADRRRSDAASALASAWAAVLAVAPERAVEPGSADRLGAEVDRLRAVVEGKRSAAGEALRVRGHLQRRPAAEAALTRSSERLQDACGQVERLRAEVKALGFDPARLQAARHEADSLAATSREATLAARAASEQAAKERASAEGKREQLARAREQHDRLRELESESRHLSRAADLLGEFRNTVVASVGPRLALQAGQLFGELTDHEYEEVRVDPETFQLQISDGGVSYDLERFSGSEVDLANLALRVAISEHIHFQSGGTVGLLVLDEVFGPLDEDRKARMLLALERLRARFRQVLVVTHDSEIKDQLPSAIEVVKLPGRRARAEVVGS